MGERIYRTALIQTLLATRRKWRVKWLLSKVDHFAGMCILDVGCGPDGRSFENFLPNTYLVTGIDLYAANEISIKHPGFTYRQRSAEDLGCFGDNQFDLAVSIGMMEHICDRSLLRRMAAEIKRVARQHVIVVPWKYACIEPHFKFPFFQLLPYGFKLGLTRSLDLHNLANTVRKNPNYIKTHYQWLSTSEWKGIFSGCTTHVAPTLDTIAVVRRSDVC